jgi:hypothetical protein
MTPDSIVNVLEASREELTAAVRGISEEQAHARPEAGRWSVLECVEHVAFVEARLLGRLEASERLDAASANPEKEAKLVRMVTDRTVRAQAPEPAVPTGRFTSMAQALDHFNAARTRTIQFVEKRGDDLYCLAAEHQRFGSLNGTELILIIAGHARRHAEQIREIAALPTGAAGRVFDPPASSVSK